MQITDGILTWLGPAADEMTPEHIARFAEEWQRVGERFPDPDEQSERDAALSAAVQYLLGETTPEDANRALIDARRREREAFAASVQIATMLVADAGGKQKSQAARAVGIDRMSLLKALGER